MFYITLIAMDSNECFFFGISSRCILNNHNGAINEINRFAYITDNIINISKGYKCGNRNNEFARKGK